MKTQQAEKFHKYMIAKLTKRIQEANNNFCIPTFEKERLTSRLEYHTRRYIEQTGMLPEWNL